MPYSTASNKTDRFGNVLKSSIAQLVYKKKWTKWWKYHLIWIIDYKPDPTPQSMEQWAEISGPSWQIPNTQKLFKMESRFNTNFLDGNTDLLLEHCARTMAVKPLSKAFISSMPLSFSLFIDYWTTECNDDSV